ncbi:hypothetical protein BJY00DRAFT_317865 [Aspergillus carlsbadensis]|nr:hypothetical protein BJY00DRAFT_317865 [Aspergillus carlsbadensis]
MVRKVEDAKIFTYARFNITALLSLARSIRGKNCSCDETQRPESGSLNWAIFIAFEDGVEWVFRSPRRSFGLPKATASEVLLSEVATMKYLRETAGSGIPVPGVFSYCATDQNDIGVPYILMSKASGVPLSTYQWTDDTISPPSNRDKSRATLSASQKWKILRQLGGIHAALSNIRFSEIGSLFMDDDDSYPTLRKCLFPSLIWNGRDGFDDTVITRGPFPESKALHTACIQALLAHVAELQMEHHLFHAPLPIVEEYDSFEEYRRATDLWNDYATVGSKVDSRTNRLGCTAAGIALVGTVPWLCERDTQTGSDGGFPLYHADLSTQNIFVDDDLNITRIIDWALPHPRDSIHYPSLLEPFFEGFIAGNGFSGRQSTPDFSHNDSFWEFFRLINLDALQDFYYVSQLLHSPSGQEVHPYLTLVKRGEEFLEAAEYVLKEDEAVDQESSRRDEEQYFSCVGEPRYVLARHLTVMAQLNTQCSLLIRGCGGGLRFICGGEMWMWALGARN